MSRGLRVLIVDDSADEAELVVRELRRNEFDPVYKRVDTKHDLKTSLEKQSWDVIISDYSMPNFDGLEALNLVQERDVDLPFILISGRIGEDLAVAAMKAGAHDYLMKDNLARLAPAIRRELKEAESRRERKKAEAELKAWRTELESRVQQRTAELAMAHQQLQAATEERKRTETEIAQAIEREQLRLGEELHDGLGQQMTGIRYMLMALHSKLKTAHPAWALDLEKVQSHMQQTVDQARDLAKGFYPVDMERVGLLVELKGICKKAGELSRIICSVESDGNPLCAELKGPTALQIFRIAQEAVHNAVKHSRAKHVTIRLDVIEDRIVLTVKDDGIGLLPNVPQTNGMGFRIMKYRAETVGGTVSVDNAPGGGLLVTCSMPIEPSRSSHQLNNATLEPA